MEMTNNLADQALVEAFHEMVGDMNFPCVGAKSALNRGTLEAVVARDIRSAWDDVRLHDELLKWSSQFRKDPEGLRSLVVIFREEAMLSEKEFERHMWDRLQSLADKDAWRGQPYDARVSADPSDPHFALSFGGQAFFAVGLHPNSSRPARRFCRPAIAFNLHAQFERLRAEGMYERMRDKIIQRDTALAGTPNPMLSRHGEASQAAQYSGREVPQAWTCPFHDVRAAE